MNQLFEFGQNMPLDYLGYATRLQKLDIDVRVACQSKKKHSSRFTFYTLNAKRLDQALI